MKIRSFLIVACMVVVPLIAMFSHRLPPGTRASIAAFVRGLAGSGPAPQARPGGGASDAAAEAATPVRTAAAGTPPVGAPVTPAVAASRPGEAPQVVPVSVVMPEAEALGRLRALGAVGVDCRPLAGHHGHVASCRLPVDSSGELERIFQATGTDAAAAAENLLRDVVAWRHAATGAGPGRAPRSGTMRF